MPKKAKRGSARYGASRKARKARRVAARPRPQPQVPVEAGATSPRPERKAAPMATTGQPRYRYVISDIRRIGILVAAVVVILIILAFVLR